MIMKRLMFPVLTALAAACAATSANAMEFFPVTLRDGTPALRGTGEIVEGDADRLRAALAGIPRGSGGEKILLLDSPGGATQHAALVAQVIQQEGVMTVVAWGDVCASACASILFPAGFARLLLGDGRLMYHPCVPDAGQGVVGGADDVALCHENIALIFGLSGLSPDWIFTGLTASRRTGMDLWLHQGNVRCFGMQQPLGAEHWSNAWPTSLPFLTPCLQLMSTGAVRWSRDWDRGGDLSPMQERLRHPIANALHFVYNWSPPDVWTHGYFEDAVTLGFRRLGYFPNQPELQLLCHVDEPDRMILLAARPEAGARAAAAVQLESRHGVLAAARQGGFVQDGAVLDVFVFPENEILRHLWEAGPALRFRLIDAGGSLVHEVATPWSNDIRMFQSVRQQCGGRFPR
jgi:hypothetical protein